MPHHAGWDTRRVTDRSARVHAASADSWQAQGRLRATVGGGAAELPGVRLMSSGIDVPQWSGGDVTDPALVDVAAVRDWYAQRSVPWGLRVPAGMAWPHGRHLLTKRCMAARREDLRLPPAVPGLDLAPAAEDELDTYAGIDATAFGEDEVGPTRDWARPMIDTDGFLPVLARLDGEPVGVAFGVRTSGSGGQSVGVFGVGVLPAARRRGVGGALTTYVLAWGIFTGADLAWLNPDTDEAARLYARLGFHETGGIDIYVDV
jgi:GNAT superfamily N-acetyltransferase